MKKRIAIITTLCLLAGTINSINIPAKTMAYEMVENIAECEVCVFESEKKQEGIITQNYVEGDKVYQCQVGEGGLWTTYIDGTKRYPTGYIYATMDGENRCPLYWSEETYKDAEGKEKYMAVLKPQDENGWSTNSAIIITPYSLSGLFATYLCASEDGPRDVKVECTVDGGKTYYQVGNGIISLNNTKQIQNILQESKYIYSLVYEVLRNDERYNECLYGKYWVDHDKIRQNENIFVRISVAVIHQITYSRLRKNSSN